MSVALCTHNGAQFISAQIESILSQSPRPDQLVISDDASNDDSVDRALEVCARFPDVEVVVLRNTVALGVTANFEQAIRSTTAPLVALSDQDDLWHSGRLARVLREFDSRPELLVVGSDATMVRSNGTPMSYTLFEALELSPGELAELQAGDAFRALLRRNLFTGATMVFRRELLDLALPFPAAWVHDEWLAAIASATGEVTILPEQLIDYRQHGGNQIGATRLGFGAKFRRLREPRTERNARLLARAVALVARLENGEGSVDAAVLAAARAKRDHEQIRSGLRRSRLRRLRPIVHELRAGGYSAYGRGRLDAVRDLVQPV